jgi:hypothetical protein
MVVCVFSLIEFGFAVVLNDEMREMLREWNGACVRVCVCVCCVCTCVHAFDAGTESCLRMKSEQAVLQVREAFCGSC